MSNEYFTQTGWPSYAANGDSASARSELLSLQNGFDKLPALAGMGLRVVRVNAGGTALESVTLTTAKILASDGSVTPTANLPMGGYKLTGLGAATVAGDSVRYEQAGTVAMVETHAAASKATPVDADELPLADSATSFSLKKLTWANLKSVLQFSAPAASKTTPVDADAVGLYDSAATTTATKLTWANLKATFLATVNTWTAAQTFSADTSVVSLNGGQLAGFRNRIINGDLSVWQRASSFTPTGAVVTYTADRWAAYRSVANYAVGQSGSVGAQAIRVQRTNATSDTNGFILTQLLETVNSVPLQGKTVTLSFQAKCGANYSAASSVLAVAIFTGTGTDETATTQINTGFAGQATALSVSPVLTTSFQTFQATTTLSAGATQIAIRFTATPVGTAGANDWFEVKGVQLEVGYVATPFELRPYGTELALCQRYFSKTFPQATAPAQNAGTVGCIYFGQIVGASTTMGVGHRFPVTMRATPTIVLYNPSAANAQIRNFGTGTDFTSTVATNADQSGLGVTGTSPAGSAPGQSCLLHCTADAEL